MLALHSQQNGSVNQNASQKNSVQENTAFKIFPYQNQEHQQRREGSSERDET
jgi:hypothetical protein